MSSKTKFYCQECGCESFKWIGKCPDCGKWNTFVEEIPLKDEKKLAYASYDKPKLLSDIDIKDTSRVLTNIEEFDRVLGGGVVAGSVILVGGDPGIGKSTLLLQVSNNLSLHAKKPVLYVSGEESAAQAKLRAQRLKLDSKNLYVLSETNINIILEYAEKLQPAALVIDSIQTMFKGDLSSSPGSVGQIRECTTQLMYFAKSKAITVFIVGHVTKEGNIAGPKVLEHIVDTVLYFEGDEHHFFRILRTTKNRFGSTNEIGVFEMRSGGLMQIENPSQIFLSEKKINSPGSVIVASQEGERPILVEMQALVSTSSFGMPQRKTIGVDYNRVSLLVAVLEKRGGLHIGGSDVFVNVVGGIEIDEPAADLGIVIALASSFKDVVVDERTVIAGEVGLSGEVRAINKIEIRIKEAEKLGFKKFIVPFGNVKELKNIKNIEVVAVSTVREAIDSCLKR